MDDVNNMDESMDEIEQSPSGVSRRDMIKASVVAGALVWSAPVLLTGRAAADHDDVWPPDPPDHNCPCAGTLVRFKIGSDIPSANCGQTRGFPWRSPAGTPKKPLCVPLKRMSSSALLRAISLKALPRL